MSLLSRPVANVLQVVVAVPDRRQPPDAYVHALKNMVYFTAGEPTYKQLVRSNYQAYLAKYDTL